MADERPGEKRGKEQPVAADLKWTILEEEAEKAGLIVRNAAATAAAPLAGPFRVVNQNPNRVFDPK